MKRRDLERHLRAHGARPEREGARHVWWTSAAGASAVPRHTEVKVGLVVAICRQLGVPAPANPR